MLLSSVCPLVRLSVTCRGDTGTVPKRLHVGSHKQRHIIAHGLVFWCQKSRRNSDVVTPIWAPNKTWSKFKLAIFNKHLAISQKRCKIGKWLLWNTNRSLSNGAVSSDLEWPLTTPSHPFSQYCIAFRIFVVGRTEFKFGTQVDRSKC